MLLTAVFSRIAHTAILLISLSPISSASASSSTIVDSDSQSLMLLIVFSAILVFIMQAGFALLETGLVRSKNAVNVLMKNYVDVCVVILIYWMVGNGVMFGENESGFFGTSKFFLDSEDPLELTQLFYQIMFAATTVTIVSGALAERIHFTAYIILSIFISALIYPIYGNWVWNETGWLNQLGFIDFAGATVVHSTGGWIALAGVIILGPRLGRFGAESHRFPILGHNLPLVALGGFLLWFGWFGFNLGSIGAINGEVPLVLMNTILGGASGGLGGILLMMLLRKPILLTSSIVASLGGLVSVTAGASTIPLNFAIFIGAVGGCIAILGIILLDKLRIDDAVGAVPCHAFAGLWGSIAAGMFIKDDLFNWGQVGVQVVGSLACAIWAFCGALVLFYGIGTFFKIRATTGQERRGLDYVEHYEVAYPEFTDVITNPGKQS